MEWLVSQGARVFVPLGHSPDVDLIAEVNGHTLRVEVKTSGVQNERGRWAIHLATNGGNQSWTGQVKRFEPDRCDHLFVHVGDGRRWFIPARELGSRVGLALGGPKWSEFEIEPGKPLPGAQGTPSRINTSGGSAGAGEPGQTVNLVPRAEWVRFPPPPSSTAAKRSRAPGTIGRTRISANHQLTIPRGPFEAAGLKVGDGFRVEAIGQGMVELTRVTECNPADHLKS